MSFQIIFLTERAKSVLGSDQIAKKEVSLDDIRVQLQFETNDDMQENRIELELRENQLDLMLQKFHEIENALKKFT